MIYNYETHKYQTTEEVLHYCLKELVDLMLDTPPSPADKFKLEDIRLQLAAW